VKRLRIAVIADFQEEGWPSMDLVAEMLVERLRVDHGAMVDAELVRPRLHRRASRIVPGKPAFSIDRVANRFWDYPRTLKRIAESFDVFHIVDHSYAHLVHALPATRTLVTCHDLDTFRSVLQPAFEPRSAAFRAMTRRILTGLRAAGHIACDTEATREALVSLAGIPADRTTVVHNGPHPSCTPTSEAAAGYEAARLIGRGRGPDLLHVGSTIERKRIDTLLEVFATVRATFAGARLIRVGGPLTAVQRRQARDLGIEEAIVTVPFLDRSTLAAIYRHCALLLLTSDREGFGLPVLEALACGTPVVASDIPALREVGGDAVTYCGVDAVDEWRQSVVDLLSERQQQPDRWAERKRRGTDRAAAFSWVRYAANLIPLYYRLAGAAAAHTSR
jgi:glycosyltransferase involved in cell wall biosynthesis